MKGVAAMLVVLIQWVVIHVAHGAHHQQETHLCVCVCVCVWVCVCV